MRHIIVIYSQFSREFRETFRNRILNLASQSAALLYASICVLDAAGYTAGHVGMARQRRRPAPAACCDTSRHALTADRTIRRETSQRHLRGLQYISRGLRVGFCRKQATRSESGGGGSTAVGCSVQRRRALAVLAGPGAEACRYGGGPHLLRGADSHSA